MCTAQPAEGGGHKHDGELVEWPGDGRRMAQRPGRAGPAWPAEAKIQRAAASPPLSPRAARLSCPPPPPPRALASASVLLSATGARCARSRFAVPRARNRSRDVRSSGGARARSRAPLARGAVSPSISRAAAGVSWRHPRVLRALQPADLLIPACIPRSTRHASLSRASCARRFHTSGARYAAEAAPCRLGGPSHKQRARVRRDQGALLTVALTVISLQRFRLSWRRCFRSVPTSRANKSNRPGE